jgi:glycosyltransferase involved in cell wall biosynthesis
MRIAINTRLLLQSKTDAYSYFVKEVFYRIAKNNQEHEFYFLFEGPPEESFISAANIHRIIVKPLARHPLLWKFWYNRQIPSILKKIKADVFVSPDSVCSLRTEVPQCLLVHNLAFLYYPHFMSKSHLRYYRKNTPLCLHKAKTIVTASEFLKKEINKQYHTPPEKISVIYGAVNSVFIPLPEEEKEIIKQKYTGGTGYFLFSSPALLEENFISVLKAYSVFKKKQKSSMKLVIVSNTQKTKLFVTLLQTYKFRNDVVLMNQLTEKELAGLVASAYAMIYPYSFKGFDELPLQALQCNVPAVVANAGSLPEIGGNAYLYFDPQNFEDIAQKMTRVYKDEDLRNELIRFGQERLIQFTWEKTALAMWDCILKTTIPDSLTFAK